MSLDYSALSISYDDIMLTQQLNQVEASIAQRVEILAAAYGSGFEKPKGSPVCQVDHLALSNHTSDQFNHRSIRRWRTQFTL